MLNVILSYLIRFSNKEYKDLDIEIEENDSIFIHKYNSDMNSFDLSLISTKNLVICSFLNHTMVPVSKNYGYYLYH